MRTKRQTALVILLAVAMSGCAGFDWGAVGGMLTCTDEYYEQGLCVGSGTPAREQTEPPAVAAPDYICTPSPHPYPFDDTVTCVAQ